MEGKGNGLSNRKVPNIHFFSVSDHAWPRAAALTTVVSHGCPTAFISAIIREIANKNMFPLQCSLYCRKLVVIFGK
jgi:hypothetical protein